MTTSYNHATHSHPIVEPSVLLIYIIVEEHRANKDVVVQRWRSLFPPTDTRYVKALTKRIDARDNFPAVAIGRHGLNEATGGDMGW